jgi:hypothetical protein
MLAQQEVLTLLETSTLIPRASEPKESLFGFEKKRDSSLRLPATSRLGVTGRASPMLARAIEALRLQACPRQAGPELQLQENYK